MCQTSACPVAGKGARPCGLSRRERDEREGVVSATRVCRQTPTFSASVGPPQNRRQGLKQRASARRALGLVSGKRPRALSMKSVWQGTCAVPGIGFARLRPARRRPCRQGAKSVAGPGWRQPRHPRPTAPGQTSRAERRRDAETHSTPRSPGTAPGAPPALPILNRLWAFHRRRSDAPGL